MGTVDDYLRAVAVWLVTEEVRVARYQLPDTSGRILRNVLVSGRDFRSFDSALCASLTMTLAKKVPAQMRRFFPVVSLRVRMTLPMNVWILGAWWF